MELIAEYSQLVEQRREEEGFTDFAMGWDLFHSSREHKISVFAGRRMGKTYNLALRAARSEHSCIIFTQSEQSAIMMFEQVEQLSQPTVRYSRGNGEYIISLAGGRRIEICMLPQENRLSSFRGRRFDGMEVMFDEYENGRFYMFMEPYRVYLESARHIVCVGSISLPGDSYAKRWFQSSGTKYFIDSPYEGVPGDSRRCEFYPSEERLMMEHLPPLDRAI